MNLTGMLVDMAGVLTLLARILVSASTALFLAYVFYIGGMLALASVVQAARRLRRRRVPRMAEARA
jgi:hypothetical protein